MGAGGWFKLLVFGLILALGTLAVLSFVKPQDLTDIEGYESPEELAKWRIRQQARDIPAILEQAVATETAVTITEEELNEWLQKNLQLTQSGVLKEAFRAESLWVRLHPERVEIIIERTLINPWATPEHIAAGQDTYPHNLSMFFDIKKTEKGISFDTAGGRFGSIGYSGVFKGYLFLVMPGFDNLAEHFAPELKLVRDSLTDITVEEGRITLRKLEARTSTIQL